MFLERVKDQFDAFIYLRWTEIVFSCALLRVYAYSSGAKTFLINSTYESASLVCVAVIVCFFL